MVTSFLSAFLFLQVSLASKSKVFEGSNINKGHTRTALTDILFDLNVDPNESTLLDPQDNNEMYQKLIDRSSYWASKVIEPEVADSSDEKVTTWVDNDGLSPWLENDKAFTPPLIKQKYTTDDAPNIVFVFVDDWGFNDVGYRSTYLSWTTPTIDKLAAEGVKLENYYTSYSCIPSRGALLTGRYPIRLGLQTMRDEAELPVTEITLGQEMQSAGYNSVMVGKWHLGFSTPDHTPANRGFDSSYTFWSGELDYWSKEYGGHKDLHDGSDLVTNPEELSTDLHNGYLMQNKAEEAIADHVKNNADKPMFLYYAMQLIHAPFSAPQIYLDRCGGPVATQVKGQGKGGPKGQGGQGGQNVDAGQSADALNYCALNVMLDEAIANLTCSLETHGMADNTVLVLVSDNGGVPVMPGNNYPFLGDKGSLFRGGLSGTGFVHSKLLPENARGSSYEGQMHVTDWLPTLMGLATNNKWSGSYTGAELDGVDQWKAITTPGTETPRSEILHYHDGIEESSIQIDMMKLNQNSPLNAISYPTVFANDLRPDLSHEACPNPSLMKGTLNFQRKNHNEVKYDDEDRIFDSHASILLIILLVSIVIMMSARLAMIMQNNEYEIKSHINENKMSDNQSGWDGQRIADEASKLLI